MDSVASRVQGEELVQLVVSPLSKPSRKAKPPNGSGATARALPLLPKPADTTAMPTRLKIRIPASSLFDGTMVRDSGDRVFDDRGRC